MDDKQTPAPQDENRLIAERRAKLTALRAKGVAYPNDFGRQNLAAELVEEYEKIDRDTLDLQPALVSVAGRLMLKRTMGKITFAQIQDMSGQIQIFVADNAPDKETHDAFRHYDIGDIVGVDGVLMKTRTGEVTVRAKALRLLAKSLRPLPEKFHGLADGELRYRQRYVDLIMNRETREVFVKRFRVIQEVRNFLLARSYIEVDTPMMQPIPGGAAARPFITHHNALDMDLYLRIAPELYLKRMVVGGFEKVFEINRNFRNEGISTRHNPEFTMLEFYAAYLNYEHLMGLIEQMIRETAEEVLGTAAISYQGHEIDLARPYQRLTVAEAIKQYHPGTTDATLADRDALTARLKELNITYRPEDGVGGLQLTLFENTVEENDFSHCSNTCAKLWRASHALWSSRR
jgi:lysyl-tRNA synthetase class 2